VNDVAIRAQGLGKKYVIGHQAERERNPTLRDVIGRTARNLVRTTSDVLRGRAMIAGDSTEDFWALKDVDFEVKRGEVLGIIGRNGAGKSTLLKILSRITEPTEGRVEIRGRVASLLEVGTGFHPELTGRENIYLNGAILGMTRAEIGRKFDEIAAFAEVEKFLDTPVKRYSSGMYVRLAFAVAAHLEPEILIVDEVLAVGDAEFQKKCLGKLSEVAGGGRMVLFVSHNMSAVSKLCSRCLLIDRGTVVADAPPASVVPLYLRQPLASEGGSEWSLAEYRSRDPRDFVLISVSVRGAKSTRSPFSPDEDIQITLRYRQRTKLTGARIALQLHAGNGDIAFVSIDGPARGENSYGPGTYESICEIPGGLLNRTNYLIRLCADIPGRQMLLDFIDIGTFAVDGIGNDGSPHGETVWPGAVCPRLNWRIRAVVPDEALRHAETGPNDVPSGVVLEG